MGDDERAALEAEQAALLSVLEPTGAPEWAQVSDIDRWSLKAAAKAIAHDLREPIVGVRRLAGWLAELAAPDATGDAERYKQLLDERLARLESRYDGLRRFIDAGIASPTSEPLLLSELASEAAVRAAQAAGIARQLVDISVSGGDRITTDRRLLARCLDELVKNSVIHGRRGAEGTQPIAVSISLERGADVWRISIRDDGVGVSDNEDEHEHLFEPFVGTGDGAGMGLAIVRRTAALRRGWCRFEVPEGPGALIMLTWPQL